MAKHAPDLIRPETFAMAVELDKRRVAFWLSHPGKVHPLRQLHTLLTQYWSLPKQLLGPRHALLTQIMTLGARYLRTKSPKHSDSEKVQTVSVLVMQASQRFRVEQYRAQQLERKINAPTQAASVQGAFGRGQRFERVASPGGTAVVGAELYRAAEEGRLGQVQLTGNDINDLYALRKLLKSLTPQQLVEAGLRPLEYADAESRSSYHLRISKRRVTWAETKMPVDTLGCVLGDPPGTGLYAADLGGEFYCRVYDQTDDKRGYFAHSSFLAGDDAICAGTVKIKYGRLIEISNLSGHYVPHRGHLADACRALLEQGYVPQRDGYALLADKKMEYPLTSAKSTGWYRFPLKLFADSAGVVSNHVDFEVTPPDAKGNVLYTDPAAAMRRGAAAEA